MSGSPLLNKNTQTGDWEVMGVYTQAAHGCMSAYWESLSDYFEAGQPIPKQFTMNFKCFELLEREDVKQDPYYLEFML